MPVLNKIYRSQARNSPLVNTQCFGQRKAEALKTRKSSTRNQDRDISQEIDLAGQTDGLEAAMKISKISMYQNKNDLKRKIAQRRKQVKVIFDHKYSRGT